MSDTHTVPYDPQGLIEAALPLDRTPYEALVTAVLAWKNPNLTSRDYEQIALRLTGHARTAAADVERHAALPKNDGRGALAEVVLREAARRLSAPIQGTAQCVQNRARLVRALYSRLDRLTEPCPATTQVGRGSGPRSQGLHALQCDAAASRTRYRTGVRADPGVRCCWPQGRLWDSLQDMHTSYLEAGPLGRR